MIGAIIGDIVGSRFEFNNYRYKDFKLFDYGCDFTDDSVMTIAVADFLINEKHNKKNVVKKLQSYGRKYTGRGYGSSFSRWLYEDNAKPYDSFGNGAAMRISAVGLYAKSEKEVKKLSKMITSVSHDHKEGLKGAEITAMCVFYASNGKSKEFIENYVSKYYDIDFDYKDLRENYCFNETCQNTVPQAIWCFLKSRDFEDCLRLSVSIGGDSDTLCAISCGIAEAYYGVPKSISDNLKSYLDLEQLKVIQDFYSKIA